MTASTDNGEQGGAEPVQDRQASPLATDKRFVRIKWALEQARRDLVDPSRRNRLLHAPLVGKRPWCTALVGHDPDELFDALYRRENFRGYAFAPRAIGDEDDGQQSQVARWEISPSGSDTNFDLEGFRESPPRPGEPQSDVEASSRSGRPRLQTRLSKENLEKRLTKIFREERTLEEEQGLSTLYLAMGFLKWYDSDDSNEPSFAPLVLVPVKMVRVQGPDGYLLQGRDDEIVVNVSLREKLRVDFTITLPEIPDDDRWVPSTYLEAVAHEVARQRRWEIESTSVGLGFFTFAKFMMWRDLDASSWPNGKLVNHSLLQVLLGENDGFQNEPPIAGDDEPIDERIDLSTAIHVVDADSSQAVVVEEARAGRNLVVQGPPGTGKSQTITNVIASAVHAGKSVLFVAEKTAALEVVHERLRRAGLGALCLEMHSRKANKREVMKSLDEALRLAGSSRFDTGVSGRLASARNKLNEYSATIHRPVGQSGQSAFDIVGIHLKLRGERVRLLDVPLDVAGDWSASKLATAKAVADRASVAVAKLSRIPKGHPWFGTDLALQNPFDVERLHSKLKSALDRVTILSSLLAKVFPHVTRKNDPTLDDAKQTALSLLHVAAAPATGRAVLSNTIWSQETAKLEAAIEEGARLSKLSVEIDSYFQPEAWDFDPAPLLLVLRADGPSFFRRVSGRYRKGAADLRAICRNDPPKVLNERIGAVEKLRDAQRDRRVFLESAPMLSSALGPLWLDMKTPWEQARALIGWSRVALSKLGGMRLVEIAAHSDNLEMFATVATQLDRATEDTRAALAEVSATVKPNIAVVYGTQDLTQAPLSRISDHIKIWLDNLHSINDWVTARDALRSLRSEGLELIADRMITGDLSPPDVRPVTQLLVAEALWKRATKDSPDLMTIDGDTRSDEVDEFRQLDQRRIQIARQEVLARYIDQRPGGYAGEMGVIRGEIDKRRGHRAIRKLIADAGSAVQRVKPVFLMSPLSVAQFLPPERITFDLLVIDEASQVAPEDALGAVARAKQIVVVGDDKQLPPTNFFKMVNAGVDDDDVDEIVADVDRPSDYESILTLSRTRGMAERMLAWHYRSKHPSLIALSNDECYAGRLLLPPSPFVQTDEFGLSLIVTARGHYDRGGTSRDLIQAEQVAKAVAEHIRRFPNKSLGVACLSVQQRDGVDDMLDRLGVRSEVEGFSPKDERLFVKNLEAIQGDERDVIFISVGYGVAPNQSKPFLNFGPVSRDGGERRLNVLASRAREKCVVFSSITAGDIPVDSEVRGTRMLRALLHFAETGKLAPGTLTGGDFDSPFEESVARVIRESGYHAHSQVGVSSFKVDLGVIDPAKPGQYLLGVECDGATYHSARSARDRDRLRQEVLEGLGWKLHRIWSTDWFRNPERESARLMAAIHAAAEQQRSPQFDISEDQEDNVSHDQPNYVPVDEGESLAAREALPKPSNVEVYRECALTAPVRRALLDLSAEEVGRLGLRVVEVEAPVHTEEIARRLREAFGLQKTGNRILAHVRDGLTRLARNGSLAREGEFWSIPGRRVQVIRDRRQAALVLRRATMIGAAEYQLAITTALNAAVAFAKDDLVVETTRLFGFDRTGPDLKQAIEAQVSALIAEGKIVEESGRLTAARPPQ